MENKIIFFLGLRFSDKLFIQCSLKAFDYVLYWNIYVIIKCNFESFKITYLKSFVWCPEKINELELL